MNDSIENIYYIQQGRIKPNCSNYFIRQIVKLLIKIRLTDFLRCNIAPLRRPSLQMHSDYRFEEALSYLGRANELHTLMSHEPSISLRRSESYPTEIEEAHVNDCR